MVRFLDDSNANTDADLRAARTVHLVIFEDGDQAPALKARTSYLQWGEVNGALTLPFEEFADFTLRFCGMPPGDSPRLAERITRRAAPRPRRRLVS